tara:strand:+ start:13551 stop:14534 length:984 start_codon:yes stop_codon:yes gene_type:complete
MIYFTARSMSSAVSFASSVRGRPVVGRRAPVARRVRAPLVTRANADIMSEVGTVQLTDAQFTAERYVASNRFKLQKDKGPTFEKRWAERKSRLANLDGFRFFTLMRRVEASPGMGGPPTTTSDDEYDYVSLTIWEDKSGFDAWRTGEAFKEAHGGGTIFGFAEMLISSLLVLKGGPKPAFYDGLLPVVKPPPEDTPWKAVGGWRDVPADGVNPLDTDVFVAMNRFKVLEGKEESFENRWAERESKLEDMDGFLTFLLLRRDALKAEDGFNYSTLTVWKNRSAFDDWRASSANKNAHSKAADAEPMFHGPPSPVLYEGVLALLSERGA